MGYDSKTKYEAIKAARKRQDVSQAGKHYAGVELDKGRAQTARCVAGR